MRGGFQVEAVEGFVHPTRTRFPFRYGIASMTEVPHLFVRVELTVEGRRVRGLASEGLPPKWFTKNPETTFDQDLPALYGVVGHAALAACRVGRVEGFFPWWQALQAAQSGWAARMGHPPLLAGLGASLLERAVLDGLCRAWELPLHRVVRDNLLGVRLGELHGALEGSEPCDWLPRVPIEALWVRHTLGLGDALTASDLAEGERVSDGLPQTLEESVRAYGLRAFKIKLFGQPERDVARLVAVEAVLRGCGLEAYWVTLDGNENFRSFGEFRAFWERFSAATALETFRKRVLFVEQPVHRDHALGEEARRELGDWQARPAMIIDESDGSLEDLPRALALGYVGTSHKNCKGIMKGLAHGCLLEQRRRRGLPAVLSGEDLCNLGPVALLQDLAVMALLGVGQVERNGHHYFRGLSPWPETWQSTACQAHPDLYIRETSGLTRLDVQEGRLRLGTVNAAPLGVGAMFDPEAAGFPRVILDETGLRPV